MRCILLKDGLIIVLNLHDSYNVITIMKNLEADMDRIVLVRYYYKGDEDGRGMK